MREANKKLLAGPKNPNWLGIEPMLLALAMELALKAWITLDQSSKTIRGHNLYKLFGMFKPEQKEKIENDLRISCLWHGPSPLYPLGMDAASVLDHHAEAFVK